MSKTSARDQSVYEQGDRLRNIVMENQNLAYGLTGSTSLPKEKKPRVQSAFGSRSSVNFAGEKFIQVRASLNDPY